ncbi:DAK2 domain-containing protein [Calderihabitans maritimus]|uniref:DAK2 domain-containing protein n=1 Tax=Calderihabitans maritimus TaxID=1246530 RepID=UPI001EE076EB|nr:DAK2 domain-containing protein [Calderihabitans maritimus]
MDNNTEKITGLQLKNMLRMAAYYLQQNEKAINELNVFPVPDGDTGTNMTMTASGAISPLEELPDDVPLGKVAVLASEAALMSARGNSGVILSQFLRGLARSLGNKDTVSCSEMAKAFQYGLVYAYQAVSSPVEGTILTVAREIARGTRKTTRESNSLVEVLTKAVEVGERALALTPTQLPALREAGVVDAGGQGLLVFLEGCLAGLKGEVLEKLPAGRGTTPVVPQAFKDISTSSLEFTYCTEALLKYRTKPDLQELKSQLETLGDSLLLVEGKDLIKFHLHTNHPGKALEILLQYGTLYDIKIDNMSEQHRQTVQVSVPMAVVAVSPGEGLDEAFKNLGVTEVVAGGDTMNPSVQQLLEAIENTRAEQVLVLPNNSNIRLAAEQAAAVSDRKVKVLPCVDVMQGLAAMFSYDPKNSLEENYENMLVRIQAIQSGRVTFAARESTWQGRSLKQGSVLGFSRGELLAVAEDVATATLELVRQLVGEDYELLTMFYGRKVTRSEAEKVADALRETFPDIEVELLPGGQPHDYFLLMLE